jgi:hypothetical protein
MALSPELLAQLGIINCDGADVRGAGLAGCRINIKRVTTLLLFSPSYIIEEEVNLALIHQLEQEGKVKILQGVVTFADSTPDFSVTTFDGSGIKTLLQEFPYEYTATFDNGVNFQKALSSISGEGNFRLGFMDVDNKIWITRSLSGDIRGFGLTMHQKGNYKGNTGAAVASETMFFQLSDRSEVDDRMDWITPTDFTASDLDDYNDISLTIDPMQVGDTTLVFTPKLADNTHLVEGTVITNWKFTKTTSGVTTTVTPTGLSYVTNPGKITVTIPAAVLADVWTVQTFNSTLGTEITLTPVGILIKSPVATAIVTA